MSDSRKKRSDARVPGLAQACLFARLASLVVILLATADLAGWYFGLPALIRPMSGLVPMAPLSGLAMLVAGVAALLSSVSGTREVGRSLALVLAAIAFMGIFQNVLPFGTWVEDMIAQGGRGTSFLSNYISPVVSLCFLFLSIALFVGGKGSRLRPLIADSLVVAVLILALATLIGYGLGATSLYRHSIHSAASLQDSLGLILLGTAVLAASPSRGMTASLLDPSPGGQVLRRLLPVVVLAPFALAWLVQRGAKEGLYSSVTETAIVALLTIIWLTMIVWVTAEIVRGADVARRRAERELSRQREWLGTTLASIGDAVIAYDRKGLIRTVNPRAETLTAWQEADANGKPITEVVRIVDEQTGQAIDVLKDLPDGSSTLVETALLMPRVGEELPIESRLSPIVGPEGQALGGVLVFRDVTEKRRDDQHQRMLVGELNHRVKNVLAVVQSLVQASARRANTRSAQDLALALAQRIQSLSNAHQLLLETQWTGARLVPMIERELAPYQDEGKATVHVRGEDVMLPAESTSILAMTLHELATNAAKYGALARADGRLKVIWRVRDGQLQLLWRERHGGSLPPHRQPGFGWQLIEKGIQRNLGGQSQIVFKPNGLRVALSVPLKRLDPREERPTP